MSTDEWGVVGILATVIIGVLGFFVAKKVQKTQQKQAVGAGGTGYQAGGDINIDSKQ